MLPDSRDATFNAATPIDPSMMNNLADWQVRTWGSLSRGDLLLIDEFDGAAFADRWSGAVSAGTVLGDDSASDGFGAAFIKPDAGVLDQKWSRPFPVGARRFRLGVRMRIATGPTQALSHFHVGLRDFGTGDSLLWGLTNGTQTTWRMTTTWAGATTDLGVALDGAYHQFLLSSDGQEVTASIDGTNLWTGHQPQPWAPKLGFYVARDVADVALDLRLDRLALWVEA